MQTESGNTLIRSNASHSSDGGIKSTFGRKIDQKEARKNYTQPGDGTIMRFDHTILSVRIYSSRISDVLSTLLLYSSSAFCCMYVSRSLVLPVVL